MENQKETCSKLCKYEGKSLHEIPPDCIGFVSNFLTSERDAYSLLLTSKYLYNVFNTPSINCFENVQFNLTKAFLGNLNALEETFPRREYPFVRSFYLNFYFFQALISKFKRKKKIEDDSKEDRDSFFFVFDENLCLFFKQTFPCARSAVILFSGCTKDQEDFSRLKIEKNLEGRMKYACRQTEVPFELPPMLNKLTLVHCWLNSKANNIKIPKSVKILNLRNSVIQSNILFDGNTYKEFVLDNSLIFFERKDERIDNFHFEKLSILNSDLRNISCSVEMLELYGDSFNEDGLMKTLSCFSEVISVKYSVNLKLPLRELFNNVKMVENMNEVKLVECPVCDFDEEQTTEEGAECCCDDNNDIMECYGCECYGEGVVHSLRAEKCSTERCDNIICKGCASVNNSRCSDCGESICAECYESFMYSMSVNMCRSCEEYKCNSGDVGRSVCGECLKKYDFPKCEVCRKKCCRSCVTVCECGRLFHLANNDFDDFGEANVCHFTYCGSESYSGCSNSSGVSFLRCKICYRSECCRDCNECICTGCSTTCSRCKGLLCFPEHRMSDCGSYCVCGEEKFKESKIFCKRCFKKPCEECGIGEENISEYFKQQEEKRKKEKKEKQSDSQI